MANKIDPELLKFLETLPPQVRELLMQDFINKKSRLGNDGRDYIFTPGEEGSLVYPRQGEMPNPALFEAFTKKRKSKIIMPEDYR